MKPCHALMTIRARVYEEHQRELDEKNDAERRTKIVPEIVPKKFVPITIRKIV